MRSSWDVGPPGLEFPLWHGNAEEVPAPDASFDLAISEYGASIWCDPYRWIPEASRLLRPGGELIFLVNGSTTNFPLVTLEWARQWPCEEIWMARKQS
ncbi:MAG TPA: methyltransferase domain-containing protein [Solirubrobacteraceae bacterium]|nr:methyltransferase domain-containing protein [Solirubrobacteraceae bacterium]